MKDKKATTTKKTTKTKNKKVETPYFEWNPIMTLQEVDPKTRTVLLLDSRNDLVTLFFGGLDVMAANYKSKAKNPYMDFVNMTCRGFIESVRDQSIKYMLGKQKQPDFGIGDIVRNRKNLKRFIINMVIEPKTNELMYVYVDPENAHTPRVSCSDKTMRSWTEK